MLYNELEVKYQKTIIIIINVIFWYPLIKHQETIIIITNVIFWYPLKHEIV